MIRPADPGDAEAINRVRLASWHAAYSAHLPARVWDELRARPWAERLARSIAEGSIDVLVAEIDDGVRGYALFGACRDDDLPDAAEVFALYVDPEYWSTGVGRGLLAAAVVALTARPITLWVLEVNERARRFYERAGFGWDGSRQDAEMPGDVLLPELRYRLG